MRLRLFMICFLLSMITSFAAAQPKKGVIYLRTNLLSFLEPDAAGPSFGIEAFVSDHFSIGTDASVIFYDAWNTSDSEGNPSGYKIKPEVRYYLFKKNMEKRVRLFFALEGIFLKTTTRNYTPLPILDNMGNVAYTYLGGYDDVKKVAGAASKAGIQIPKFIFKNMLIEFYVGIGVRDKKYTVKNVPAGGFVEPVLGSRSFNTTTDGAYPSIPLGFKILYKIR